jgi:hypothetical protein
MTNPIGATPKTLYRLAPAVYLARQQDITRVLDLDRGRFYGLDTIASQLLRLTLEQGPDAAASEVAAAYGTEPSRVRGDLRELLAGLQRRGLLQQGGGAAAPAARWLPRWLAGPCRVGGPEDVTARLAGRLLRRAWWSLRLDDWAGTLRRWRRPAAEVTCPPGWPGDLATAVDGAIREAVADTLLFPAACKERAVVGHHLLRAVFGLPAVLVVGVQHYPFSLHAWVDLEGRTVADDADFCAGFEPVARFE